MQQTPDLIGSKDACKMLDIDRSTLTRWVGNGRIVPVAKLPTKNGAYLFARADVEQLREPVEPVAS